MTTSPEAKLNELRAKTDRQLVALIGKKLDRGITLVSEGSVQHAMRAHSEAAAWLPLLTDVTPLERRRVENKAARLQDLLRQTSVLRDRARPAC